MKTQVRWLGSLVVCLSLVACGGGSGSGTPTTAPTTAPTTPAGTAAPTDAPSDPGGGGEPLTAAEEVFARFAGMTGQERRDALLAAAQEEGGPLVIYGTGSSVALGEAFQAEFGLAVEVFDTEPEQQLVRITQEARAGQHLFDLTNNSAINMTTLGQTGLLARYESEYRSALPAGAQGEFWTGNVRNAYMVGHNTELAPGETLPDDYLGFADPEWAGRITLELGSVEWYAALSKYYVNERGMSQADVDAALEAIAANARTMRGQSNTAALVAAGQVEVCLQCFLHHMVQRQREGAPVDFALVTPVVDRYDGLGVAKHAPHPATALLFMDWALSLEGGAQVIIDSGRLPTVDFEGNPTAGAEFTALELVEYVDELEEWTRRYDNLLRGVPEVTS